MTPPMTGQTMKPLSHTRPDTRRVARRRVGLLVLLTLPAWAAVGHAGGLPPATGAPSVSPGLPYGAGYEQRLRAARSTAHGSPSLPRSMTEAAAPLRQSGFGGADAGSGSGGQGSGRGGSGRGR